MTGINECCECGKPLFSTSPDCKFPGNHRAQRTESKPRTGNAVVWALWHMYGDGSGAHVERVYVDEDRARSDFDLLTEGPTKSAAHEWHLDKVQFVASIYK